MVGKRVNFNFNFTFTFYLYLYFYFYGLSSKGSKSEIWTKYTWFFNAQISIDFDLFPFIPCRPVLQFIIRSIPIVAQYFDAIPATVYITT
jgi:hypothetical protein